MAFQITQAYLVNEVYQSVLAVLALHTFEEIEVTAFSRPIPEVRTIWSWHDDVAKFMQQFTGTHSSPISYNINIHKLQL